MIWQVMPCDLRRHELDIFMGEDDLFWPAINVVEVQPKAQRRQIRIIIVTTLCLLDGFAGLCFSTDVTGRWIMSQSTAE